MASSSRFYFYDSTGAELPDALNGARFDGTGRFVDPTAANQPNADAWARRRTELHIARDSKHTDIQTVTVQDFGGPVLVKLWSPYSRRGCADWFWLVPAEGNS